jgi:hypothetical protein
MTLSSQAIPMSTPIVGTATTTSRITVNSSRPNSTDWSMPACCGLMPKMP